MSATFFDLKKFRDSSITLTDLGSNHLLAEHLTSNESWSFSYDSSTTGPFSCHVFHNPAYSSCIETGNFWFDSPLWHETGCYNVDKFRGTFGSDHNKFDFIGYRQNGLCLKYTRSKYSDILADLGIEGEIEEVEKVEEVEEVDEMDKTKRLEPPPSLTPRHIEEPE